MFGSGLAHRLFPGRPASGHPAARAQAFLRARISAVLFSRACTGCPVRSASARAESGGAPRRRLRGSCGTATPRPCRRRQSAQAARRRLCGCGPRSSRTCPTRASTSGTPHRSPSLPGVPPRTPHHRPRSATARRPARTAWSTGAANSRKTTEPPPSRPAANSILGSHGLPRTRGTGLRMPSRPGQTGIPSRRGFPPGTAAPPPSRPPRTAPTPRRPARPGAGDETETSRAGRERRKACTQFRHRSNIPARRRATHLIYLAAIDHRCGPPA